ncbi:MAG: MarC family protein [Dehalococcoidia bacterium]
MIDVLRAAAGIFATFAPFALIPAFLAIPRREGGEGRHETVGLAVGVALGALAVVVLLTDLFLGALDVAPESFQGAAAVIMLPLAARLLWSGRALDPGEHVTSRPWLTPLAVPGLVGPGSMAAVIAYTGRYGELDAAAAIVLALGVTAGTLVGGELVTRRLGDVALNIIGRLSGAFIVVIALELAVVGVKSV